MQQRVGLAQALINNPDLLILDEPTSGLDPLGRMKVREIIQRLKDEGKTVFFSSHELGEVETVCDRVAILHQGELKVEGRVSDLAREHQCNLEQLFLRVIGYQAGPGASPSGSGDAEVLARPLTPYEGEREKRSPFLASHQAAWATKPPGAAVPNSCAPLSTTS